MNIFHLFVKDNEMGDEFTGQSFINHKTAERRATQLRKTFKDVEIRRGVLFGRIRKENDK